MRTRSALIRDYFECSFEIKDERDRDVLRFPFGDAVEEVWTDGKEHGGGADLPLSR
jgi:hypothetical protein